MLKSAGLRMESYRAPLVTDQLNVTPFTVTLCAQPLWHDVFVQLSAGHFVQKDTVWHHMEGFAEVQKCYIHSRYLRLQCLWVNLYLDNVFLGSYYCKYKLCQKKIFTDNCPCHLWCNLGSVLEYFLCAARNSIGSL